MRLRLATNRINCRRDRRWIRRAPPETLDDRLRGLPRDAGDIGHGVGAHPGDLALGSGELDRKLVLEGLPLGLRIGRGCVVTIACDRGDRYFAPMRWEKHYDW